MDVNFSSPLFLQILFITLLIVIIIALSVNLKQEHFQDCPYKVKDSALGRLPHSHKGDFDTINCPDHSQLSSHNHIPNVQTTTQESK